jgi:hypothetical protein
MHDYRSKGIEYLLIAEGEGEFWYKNIKDGTENE